MIKINDIASLKRVLFTLVILWQTSVFANTTPEYLVNNHDNQIEEIPMPDINLALEQPLVKLIQIETVKLTDNSGLIYIGGKVNPADLELYLSQMKKILGNDFALYRQNQSARDHQSFHMTLINPYEYQALKKDIAIGTTLSVSLSGLGRVILNDKTTYFVVAQSSQATSYRQNLVLNNKDFHVTLGFSPSDIYGVNKGIESLIK
ncbi:hypothetical protein CXF85_15765 [Colwellia sp. 75C3]|uniref:hypothetical protein n=1 Tax=Colwellia sp. 75C3 TaxID=888425 RepID=UPI000C326EFD|nr:hypothetical protein [Colwellia sp. 75C3]PKG81990.1 hypothetical protein CXF85_15765 [Colwellia sp. 75C3]